MKSALTLLLFAFFTVAPSAFAADSSQAEKDLLAALATWRQAMLKADGATLDKLYHEDLSYTHSGGRIETRAEAIATTTAPGGASSVVEYHDIVTKVYGDSAVMKGMFDITTKAGVLNHSYVLMVWLKGPRGWQMVARHAVNLPAQ
jgi:ketosteroid isomerase-like protein